MIFFHQEIDSHFIIFSLLAVPLSLRLWLLLLLLVLPISFGHSVARRFAAVIYEFGKEQAEESRRSLKCRRCAEPGAVYFD